MTLTDLIDSLIPDARPPSLPDRAPRCMEDELLPDATPLPLPTPRQDRLREWAEQEGWL